MLASMWMAVGSELPISANSFSYGFLYTPEHIQLQQTVRCARHTFTGMTANATLRLAHPISIPKLPLLSCLRITFVAAQLKTWYLRAALLFVCSLLCLAFGRFMLDGHIPLHLHRFIYMNMLAVYGNCENEKYSSIAVWSDGGGIHGVYMPAKILLSLISGDRVFVHWYVRLSVCVCVCVQDSVLQHRQEYRLQCGYASST